MKKEIIALIYSIITNFIVSMMKITTGLLGNCNSLISDGLHTICDFITDIFALIGMNLSKKRPNKNHPFGYGKVEYITNVFIGILILILGVYIIIESFNKESIKPDISIIFVILIIIVIKTISTIYISHVGKKLKSNLLLSAYKISLSDIYSTILVLVIVVLSQFKEKIFFLKYLDMIGSLIIGITVFKMAVKVIRENVLALIGETYIDKELYKNIEEEINSIPKIKLEHLSLIKYGFYYRASLKIDVSPKMKIKEFVNIENIIKKKLKKKKYHIKYINVDIDTLKNNEYNKNSVIKYKTNKSIKN